MRISDWSSDVCSSDLGISVPVLLAASAGDRVVHTGRAVKLLKRIPRHEIALFDGAHELLRERDDVRRAIWERIDRFMEDNAQCGMWMSRSSAAGSPDRKSAG